MRLYTQVPISKQAEHKQRRKGQTHLSMKWISGHVSNTFMNRIWEQIQGNKQRRNAKEVTV